MILSVNSEGFDGVEIFPNPAHNVILIRGSLKQPGLVKLFRMDGVSFTERATYSDGLMRVSVEHLSSGIYFIQINGNYLMFIKKTQ